MKVAFSKEAWCMNSSNDQLIMQENRSPDNCYLWTPQNAFHIKTQEDIELWHKKLGHTNYRNIQKVIAKEAVGTTKVLKLLHMDLMGPMQVESVAGKNYVYVCVDNFSRYTWIEFIKEKSYTFEVFKQLALQAQREKGFNIITIRSNRGKEFENSRFHEFCSEEGIKHEYSAPITPQHNGIVERKNMTLQEMARVMLHAKKIPVKFWAEAINTACHSHSKITFKLASVTFWLIESKSKNLTSRLMRGFFWAIPETTDP
ncbi:hypothetical protein LIER_13637 [Lithospermum erythrorhizon]|uniref:Integrase catalytic domain-containing protein n=1 Tax=Lithospermum erythrorhizon TaxID=34254 RepID=A0AAV3PX08_LITER